MNWQLQRRQQGKIERKNSMQEKYKWIFYRVDCKIFFYLLICFFVWIGVVCLFVFHVYFDCCTCGVVWLILLCLFCMCIVCALFSFVFWPCSERSLFVAWVGGCSCHGCMRYCDTPWLVFTENLRKRCSNIRGEISDNIKESNGE